jgi:hypothetical protein
MRRSFQNSDAIVRVGHLNLLSHLSICSDSQKYVPFYQVKVHTCQNLVLQSNNRFAHLSRATFDKKCATNFASFSLIRVYGFMLIQSSNIRAFSSIHKITERINKR